VFGPHTPAVAVGAKPTSAPTSHHAPAAALDKGISRTHILEQEVEPVVLVVLAVLWYRAAKAIQYKTQYMSIVLAAAINSLTPSNPRTTPLHYASSHKAGAKSNHDS
jgi:hypothetical protein